MVNVVLVLFQAQSVSFITLTLHSSFTRPDLCSPNPTWRRTCASDPSPLRSTSRIPTVPGTRHPRHGFRAPNRNTEREREEEKIDSEVLMIQIAIKEIVRMECN